MPSEFVEHFTRSLELSASRPGSPSTLPREEEIQTHARALGVSTSTSTSRKPALHALLVSLNKNTIAPADVQRCLRSLQDIINTGNLYEGGDVAEVAQDSEEVALEAAIIGKLTVALYSDALDTFLTQATEVEAEAEWWAEIEASRLRVGLYLVQTLPIRVFNVVRTIIGTIHAHQLPLNLSTFSLSSLRPLFRSSSHFTLQPGLLATALFPHLKSQRSLSLAVLLPSTQFSSWSDFDPSISSSNQAGIVMKRVTRALRNMFESASLAVRCINLPFDLTRQECRYKKTALERIRDERAEVLGMLAQLRSPLAELISGTVSMRINTLAKREYTSLLDSLVRIVSPSQSTPRISSSSPLEPLAELTQTFPLVTQMHTQILRQKNLRRPSTLTRMWPRLLVFPPLALYIYTSRTSWIPALIGMATDAQETVRGFVQGWLVEPLLGVLHTVRAGGKGEMLVTEEGVKSDLESLQRMTLSLAQDSLHYSPSELEALAEKVRMGDLTPVMQAYEEDIRQPLRSALTGTLLRNAFIQVQKAKVDIDQALAGIDRLLKSQELTFAFVGVAPALAIVWVFAGAVSHVWSSKGRGIYGSLNKRRGVWERMRRIERILILQPSTSKTGPETQPPIPPLPTGLMILSLTRLRSYALTYLPTKIQAPFLEDLGDLEDTQLHREAKLRVVERMWRCWGQGGEAVIRF